MSLIQRCPCTRGSMVQIYMYTISRSFHSHHWLSRYKDRKKFVKNMTTAVFVHTDGYTCMYHVHVQTMHIPVKGHMALESAVAVAMENSGGWNWGGSVRYCQCSWLRLGGKPD